MIERWLRLTGFAHIRAVRAGYISLIDMTDNLAGDARWEYF